MINMKKYIIFAVVALGMLAGCSSEENIGVVAPSEPTVTPDSSAYAIMFSSMSKGVTRADHVGADAANLLNRHFTVGGFKHGSEDKLVFDNYVVKWSPNTAQTTETNTNDWEYVGEIALAPAGIAGHKQAVKYWDYLTNYYDFIAYSSGTATVAANKMASEITDGDHVGVTAIDYANRATKAYTLSGTRVGLAKCYIADMVTVKKPDYQNVVKLFFRSLATKVRMAIYETIPGYSVKDVKFYVDDMRKISEGATEIEANLFTPGSAVTDKFFTHGTFTIYYPHTGSTNEGGADYNVAHSSFEPLTSGTQTTQRFGRLQYTGREEWETVDDNIYLGRTLATATFPNSKDYTIMLPNETGTVLELRIDYTLVSVDGTGEEIKVYGAKALVPAKYAQWKPNYAYTYIFKISDNTSGWTSNVVDGDGNPVDPSGLYPITFDAAVVDTEEGKQSTITTVSMPSITTYQKGHNVRANEYFASSGDIYIQVMKDGALVRPLANSGSHPVQVWTVTGSANPTEADIMFALNVREQVGSTSTTGRNGIKLTKVTTSTDFTTIPGVDGNNIIIAAGDAAKFTPAAATTYAVTYKGDSSGETYIYTAQIFAAGDAEPSDWGTAGVWFMDPAGQTPVGAFAAGTYYKKYTNRNIDWGVKVIKVQ